MPPQPAPTPTRRAVTQLDHRIEAVTGHRRTPTTQALKSLARPGASRPAPVKRR